jgi:cell division protein FtsI (penicillin-binding protein 3)
MRYHYSKKPEMRPEVRIRWIMITAMAMFGVLWLKTFHIQVVKKDYYASRAENQSLGRVVYSAPRGLLFDRNYKPLVYNAEVSAQTLFGEGVQNSAQRAPITRVYPYGSLASTVLGYVGRAGHGTMGIEYEYNRQLSGENGWRLRRMNATRGEFFDPTMDGQPPTPGLDAVLTLDVEIQAIVELALKRGVERSQSSRGAAMVLDPRTGDVLAMASFPSFDPNKTWAVKLENTRNDWVATVFEPGSTFKLITAAAALEEKKIRPLDTIDANMGVFRIYGDVIRDTRKMGLITFYEAMAYSSNVAFAKVSQMVSSHRFHKYIRDFGLGVQTGVNLPGEERGQVRPVSAWSGRSQVTIAMGHEILTTPLQMVMAYGAVANKGRLMRPRIIREWRDSETGHVVIHNPIHEVRRVISLETADQLLEMMQHVVEYGTGRSLATPVVPISGKTGTSEKFDFAKNRYESGKIMASFAGFIPAINPRFVCMVIMDEPQKYQSGSQAAGPVFKEIAEKIYLHPVNYLEIWDNPQADYVLRSQPNTRRTTQNLTAWSREMGMPDFAGKTLREALELASRHHLKLNYDGFGRVISQNPVAGAKFEDGSEIIIQLGDAS